MTYLFFDIESANSLGGFGKICSFGYILCNSNFSEIQSGDILINPDCPFDPYLFRHNSRCRLSYRREEYRRQQKFPQYYSKIKSLLSAPNTLVVGFGIESDIVTIMNECIRYNLEPIPFDCYNLHSPLTSFYETQGRLENFVEKLGVSSIGLEFHDSKADAIFTMRCAQKLCLDAQKSLEDIFTAFPPINSLNTHKARIKKLFQTWLLRSEAKKAKYGKPLRTPKKVSVPDWFDYRRELLAELSWQEENAKDTDK